MVKKLMFGESPDTMTAADADAAIAKRLVVLPQMMGSLYPSILNSEIEVIQHFLDFGVWPAGYLTAEEKTRLIEL